MSPRVPAERREQYIEERRNQILDAAVEIFGEKDLDVATVDDIAQAAGISKGTIYLYFKNKNDIFDTILAERSFVPQMADLIDSYDSSTKQAELPLPTFLEQIGNRYLKTIDKHYPLFRLILTNAHKFPIQTEHVYNNLILKANKMLAEFLSTQSKANKIKKLESPLITARCFLGMLIIYVISQEMFEGKKFTPIERVDWIKEMVNLFLEGIMIRNP